MNRFTQPHLYDGERSKEFVETVQNIANGIFYDYWNDEVEFDWDSVKNLFEEDEDE